MDYRLSGATSYHLQDAEKSLPTRMPRLVPNRAGVENLGGRLGAALGAGLPEAYEDALTH